MFRRLLGNTVKLQAAQQQTSTVLTQDTGCTEDLLGILCQPKASASRPLTLDYQRAKIHQQMVATHACGSLNTSSLQYLWQRWLTTSSVVFLVQGSR